MLSDPDTKVPTLKVLVQMTETQHRQLGLALRHTFFKIAFLPSPTSSRSQMTKVVRDAHLWDYNSPQNLVFHELLFYFSDLPRSELMSVVTTFCVLVCENKFRQQAWSLARSLLTSQMGHRYEA
ncbi:hypothetical protein KIN20_016409 [Parelaphostrongylus tenuis]|uniref:Uncharacterized protein n=1 Tax=Parelaphostrongylus tenuis TaxID=148309 RepID=A0AAD5N1X4_PARTN|nr:hypothetical protein KIN20_016409 [Parelaphostrongylus tenuis]